MGGFKYIFTYIYTISPACVKITMTLIIGEIIIEFNIFYFFYFGKSMNTCRIKKIKSQFLTHFQLLNARFSIFL